MYSLSNAGTASRSTTPQHHRLQPQQQHSHHHQQYLIDDAQDHMRLVHSHNGGITHSYTLPHNLSHHGKAGGGVIQQYMTLNRKNKVKLRELLLIYYFLSSPYIVH